MGVLELLREADAAGLKISIEGGKIRVRGPESANDLVQKLASHKLEVLKALQKEARTANDLIEYLTFLKKWRSQNPSALPPVPPFPERPERPIAWAAWWDAVESQRRNRLNNERG